MKNFPDNIAEIRECARENAEDGAVVSAYYGADKFEVLRLLNESLATEIVCVLRYQFHHAMAKGINSMGVAKEFMEHANEEQQHVAKLAARIGQLGGKPNFDPAGLLERAHTDYTEGSSLKEMIQEDLVAERIAIGIYQEFIKYLGSNDPTTRNMLEQILADEEEHADELSNLLVQTKVSDEAPGKVKRSYPGQEKRYAI